MILFKYFKNLSQQTARIFSRNSCQIAECLPVFLEKHGHDKKRVLAFYEAYQQKFDAQFFYKKPEYRSNGYRCCVAMLSEFLPFKDSIVEQNTKNMIAFKNLILNNQIINYEETILLFYKRLHEPYMSDSPLNENQRQMMQTTLIDLYRENLECSEIRLVQGLLKIQSYERGSKDWYITDWNSIIPDRKTASNLYNSAHEIMDIKNKTFLHFQLEKELPEKSHALHKKHKI